MIKTAHLMYHSAGLMWGMVTFLTAFTFLFFLKTSLATRLLSGIPLAFVLGLIIWCVTDNWEEGWWFTSVLNRGVRLTSDAVELLKLGRSTLHSTSSKDPVASVSAV